MQSFSALYREYRGLVRSVLFKISGPADLDDLVQETFVHIWKGYSKFKQSSKLKTWIYRITVNVAVDSYRKNKKRGLEVVLDPERQESHSGANQIVCKDLVQKGLTCLKPSHRAVLVLHCMEDIPLKEVAEILKTSIGTIKSRLFYAKKIMLEFLQKNGVKL